MGRMEKNMFWVIVAALVINGFAVQSISRRLELLREEVEEFRQYMMGEKTPRDR
jgi:hypothetical protein